MIAWSLDQVDRLFSISIGTIITIVLSTRDWDENME